MSRQKLLTRVWNRGVSSGLFSPRFEPIQKVADSIDYVEVADPDTLRVYEKQERVGERALVALAVRIGPARLIDNVVLGEDAAPCGEDAG